MKYDDKIAAKEISLWLVGLGLLLVSFSSWAGNSNVLAAGFNHTCGIKTDSTIVCWGDDSMGQTTSPSGTFTQISAGFYHTCGLKIGGTISCWGDNSSGQSSQPPGTYLQVTAGGTLRESHTCALKRDSTVICWGSNSGSQSSPLPGVFTQITAGDEFTCGLKPNKTVECWGNAPTLPTNTFISISAGFNGVCGLKTDGTGTCWGERLSYDTLGFLSQLDRSPGYYSEYGGICGLKSDKTVECWGLSSEPQSGTFTYVAAGTLHACGIRNNGLVACWGHNGYAQATPPTGVTFKQPGAVVGIPPSSCTQAELNAKYSVGYKAGVAAAGGKTIKLTNISTRALVQGGAYNVIAGFVVTGAGTQKVLIRGWGIEAGVDPTLTLQTYPEGTTLAINNSWQTDPHANKIPAQMKPTKATDAALFRYLAAGAYTAILSTTGGKGLGLIGVNAID